jgi:hypothetical protein
MKMRGRLTGLAAIALAILFASGGVHAQSPQEPQAPPMLPPGQHEAHGGRAPGEAFDFVAFEGGFAGKTVTGAPFSASVSMQITQTLADGNRIERTTSGTLARDSQGRTRRDITFPAIGPWAASGQAAPHMILVNDPVAGTRYLLNPDRKVAHKIGEHNWNAPGAGGKEESGRHPGGQDEVTTDLGKRKINGVEAQGTRITRTIPAGAIGNEKPIAIVTERWYSADLQMNVLVKHSDLRMGENVFQLTDIQRQEPDASLFKVPADYTVRHGFLGGRGGAARKRRQAQQPLPPPAGENEPMEAPPPPPQAPQE